MNEQQIKTFPPFFPQGKNQRGIKPTNQKQNAKRFNRIVLGKFIMGDKGAETL